LVGIVGRVGVGVNITDNVRKPLLQLGVLCLRLLQDGDVGVGVFPEREEILVDGERPYAGGIGVHALGATAKRLPHPQQ
jgi:hypothetical protein